LQVSTPGRLLALLKRDEISLDNVLTVVLDEADVLFMDQTFPLQPIGAATPESAQFVFTTATLPEIVTEQITAEFPEAEVLTGPGLHRIAPTVSCMDILVPNSGY
jgi:ATP-dependent RNA helicase DDX18/HAS1